ncbi:MAG: GTPase Era [Rhodospirillaceae bacterium]|nr:GTPase Era [Rhodospirillaceae bacterium]|tara:strand:- start:12954 stop:13859 length:906 start_codon:yes stop_codon:yes gene_type:complete
MTERTETRCGYVALVGAPNAGKSTLMNHIMGTKVSIVTHKVQTTRARVVGVLTQDASQVVFVDTPGIFSPNRRLERAMVAAAWSGAADADKIVLLIDAERGLSEDVQLIIEGLKKSERLAYAALNKIDLIPREGLLSLAQEIQAAECFENIFMISALKGDGVQDLVDTLMTILPPGPWLYPEDHLSDMNDRLFAAEITREKLFLSLHQELPYSLTVETEGWEERKDGSVKIDQVIYVERSGHKGIVLGKGGQQVKRVGAEARKELEQILDRRVHLFLFVKVRENWRDDPERYREMGLDFSE